MPDSAAPSPKTRSPQSAELHSRKIGALWLHTSKTGYKYLSGTLELKEANGSIRKININVLKINFKTNDNQPDYEVFIQRNLAAEAFLEGPPATISTPPATSSLS